MSPSGKALRTVQSGEWKSEPLRSNSRVSSGSLASVELELPEFDRSRILSVFVEHAEHDLHSKFDHLLNPLQTLEK